MPNGGAVRVAEFDALTAPGGGGAVVGWGGVPAWARGGGARRPYGDRGRLLRTARELASSWTWLEVSEALDSWPFLSAGASAAPDGSTSADLHAVSAAYHARFGRSLVVAPSGRTTSDLLRLAVRRLLMDEESERLATTAELREISLRRLRRMIA